MDILSTSPFYKFPMGSPYEDTIITATMTRFMFPDSWTVQICKLTQNNGAVSIGALYSPSGSAFTDAEVNAAGGPDEFIKSQFIRIEQATNGIFPIKPPPVNWTKLSFSSSVMDCKKLFLRLVDVYKNSPQMNKDLYYAIADLRNLILNYSTANEVREICKEVYPTIIPPDVKSLADVYKILHDSDERSYPFT